MAKRARGSSKPGQRRPVQRPGGKPTAPARPSGSLTAAEEARAAELEAQLLAEERAAVGARERNRDRGRASDEGRVVRPAPGLLAQRASEEYGYVVRDVRRIVRIGGGLMIALLALWVARAVLGLF